ncbi:hypothetical protein JW756_07100 [Candidatus Woesearchaeota archaeon]|nr:hypothetical protein [Candidatus Woesearchaeota archaeon]
MGIEQILKPMEGDEPKEEHLPGDAVQTETWNGTIELKYISLHGEDAKLILEGTLDFPAGYCEDLNKLQLLLKKKSYQDYQPLDNLFPFRFFSIQTAKQEECSVPFELTANDLGIDEVEGKFKVYNLPLRKTMIGKRMELKKIHGERELAFGKYDIITLRPTLDSITKVKDTLIQNCRSYVHISWTAASFTAPDGKRHPVYSSLNLYTGFRRH